MGSRTRVRTDVTVPQRADWTDNRGSQGSFSVPPSYTRDIMTDVEMTGFYKASRLGHVINNPMNIYRASWENGTGTRTAIRSSDGYTLNYVGAVTRYLYDADKPVTPSISIEGRPGSSSIDDEINELFREAYLEALSNLDDTPYAFMEDLLEIKGTVDLLRDLVPDLRSAYRRMREITAEELSRGLSLTASVSRAWLVVRMVVSPLVRSMMDIVESAKNPRRMPQRQTARGRGSAVYTRNGSWSNGYRSWTCVGGGTVKVRVGILHAVTNPYYNFTWQNGLRLRDVPHGLWAVMPYSWAIDRFYNVGRTLRALHNVADPSFQVLAAWKTIEHDSAISWDLSSDVSPGWSISNSSTTMIGSEYRKTRTPIGVGSSEFPFQRRAPINLNTASIIDILSLFGSRMSFN
nr:MAG: maturation protein [Leviviridae sp.]